MESNPKTATEATQEANKAVVASVVGILESALSGHSPSSYKTLIKSAIKLLRQLRFS